MAEPAVPGLVAFVNNSNETFTPTVSGAIATCIWECVRASADGAEPVVLTRDTQATAYSWPHTLLIPAAPRSIRPMRARRAWRRLTGWAHVDQAAYARQVLARLRTLGPSAVICSNDPEIAVHLARHLPETTVVHWFHNLEVASDRWRREYAASRVVSVAVSAYLASAVETLYALPRRSVHVCLNGVDGSRFGPTVAPQDRPTIGFVGRIAVEKAPDTLLRACLLLAERDRSFAVQLIGDTNWGRSDPGAYRSEVDSLCDRLADRGVEVARTGHLGRDELPAAMARAAIHVVPSRWDEPFGLTTVEGMATGSAIVATATGGTPEVVAGAGRLVARDDPGALADALAELLDSPETRAELGAAARSRAEGLTWSATWKRLHALCVSQLTQTPPMPTSLR